MMTVTGRLNLILLLAWALVLAGCATRPTIVRERIERVSVPVARGCLAGERPSAVLPMSAEIGPSDWAALTPRQKAAHLAAQGLRHQSRAELLDAATSACK